MRIIAGTYVAIAAGAVLAAAQRCTGVVRRRRRGRGAAAAPKPDNPQSLAHIDAAKKLAGTDPWLLSPYTFYCVAGNGRGNNAEAPELEPVRLFDNVYAVGNSEATVYAIVTSQGIILIDSGYADRVETVVIPG